jgi:hypothetical protein
MENAFKKTNLAFFLPEKSLAFREEVCIWAGRGQGYRF